MLNFRVEGLWFIVLEPFHPSITTKWRFCFQHSSLQIVEGRKYVRHKYHATFLRWGGLGS
jgi:hypothetical protein